MILVTGATGILGRVIVLELLSQGHKVRAAKREMSSIEEVRKSFHYYTENPNEYFKKIEWVNLDFEDSFSLKRALEGVEEVYHCAAKVSFNPAQKKEIYHTNIEGTKQLLYACEISSVKNFCFISSIAVLDTYNEQGELDEDSEFNPKIEHSAYAKSKHFSEMEVWRASAEGLNVVVLNPGVIIGSGNWKSSSGEMFATYLKNPFSTGGSTSFVDVRDVAKIATTLMEKKIFGERFILISENKNFSETANFLRQKIGKPKVKIIPKGVLQVGSVFNFLLGWLIPSLRMANKTNIEAITSHNTVSNEKIKSRLDFHFIPVNESLDFHFKNFLSHNNS